VYVKNQVKGLAYVAVAVSVALWVGAGVSSCSSVEQPAETAPAAPTKPPEPEVREANLVPVRMPDGSTKNCYWVYGDYGIRFTFCDNAQMVEAPTGGTN
jgi:hypothetical protein